MSIDLGVMIVYLYRANHATHGTQNIIDIISIDTGWGPRHNSLIGASPLIEWGYMVAQLVEALRYKPKGCGFDSRRSHWNFSVT